MSTAELRTAQEQIAEVERIISEIKRNAPFRTIKLYRVIQDLRQLTEDLIESAVLTEDEQGAFEGPLRELITALEKAKNGCKFVEAVR